MLRILAKADRLGVNFNTPIAVAMLGTKKRKNVSYITSADVAKYLQVDDKSAHGIKHANALDRFSIQSIIVGACVLMDVAD